MATHPYSPLPSKPPSYDSFSSIIPQEKPPANAAKLAAHKGIQGGQQSSDKTKAAQSSEITAKVVDAKSLAKNDTAAKVNSAALTMCIKGPNGEDMPVGKPQLVETLDTRKYYDERDRVIMVSQFPSSVYEDGESGRALEDIDYAKFGMKKIGGIWVDPDNKKAVQKASELNAGCCIS